MKGILFPAFLHTRKHTSKRTKNMCHQHRLGSLMTRQWRVTHSESLILILLLPVLGMIVSKLCIDKEEVSSALAVPSLLGMASF